MFVPELSAPTKPVVARDYVNGRGPQDTSSAKQDEVDCGRDGAKRKVSGADSSGTEKEGD